MLHLPSYHIGIALGRFALATGNVTRNVEQIAQGILAALEEIERGDRTIPATRQPITYSAFSALEGYAFGANLRLAELV